MAEVAPVEYVSYCMDIEFGIVALTRNAVRMSDCSFGELHAALKEAAYGTTRGYTLMKMKLDADTPHAEARWLWDYVQEHFDALGLDVPVGEERRRLRLYRVIALLGDPYHPYQHDGQGRDVLGSSATMPDGDGPKKPPGITCSPMSDGRWKDTLGFLLGYDDPVSDDGVARWYVDSELKTHQYAAWITYLCPSPAAQKSLEDVAKVSPSGQSNPPSTHAGGLIPPPRR